jgi:UDP-N-acetylmuramoylalanine--D-glutamate ligase
MSDPRPAGMFAGQRAVVIGLGASGRASAQVLLDEGADVWVSEARTPAQLNAAAESEPEQDLGGIPDVRVMAGGHRPEHLDGATVVVVSPGVPQSAPVIGWAVERGLPVISELELGAKLCRVPYVAVTGTNGKTTTVEMVAAIMRAAGLSARACGNVGYPFSIAAREAFDALAVEASSFQLRFHQTFHPKVSVLLNVAPDHLDWHGSFEAYAQAKARIFARQSGDDVHLGNRDDAEAARISRTASCRIGWFGAFAPLPGDVGVEGDRVVGWIEDERVDLGGPRLASRSFLSDAAAAAAAALAFGLPPEAIRGCVESFEPLPHRGTTVAQARSVRFVDDSKATNPHAALAALAGLEGVVLIAGGLAKGVDLSPLAAAAPRLSAVVAIGEAAPEIERIFEGRVLAIRAASIEKAAQRAFDLAPPGGYVVLAPACASQDMFRDYRERGDRFTAAARAIAGRFPAAVSSR